MNAVNSAEHHRASTFYVDSKGGCDENDGRSEAAPFKTLERVSRESYGPGDRIRFRRGRTYCGSLTLNACGHAAAPVRVEAYGSGTAPKIAGQGGAAVTIRAVYLTLEGLEITNPGGLFGIHILPLKSGENSGITVSGCYIHDVNEEETPGWGGYIGSGGIIARADGEEPVWFRDMVLQDNIIRNTSRMGITISNSWGWRYGGAGYIRNQYVDDDNGWYPNRNCRIIGNTVDGTKGDSILVQCGQDVLIERNTVYRANASLKDHAKIAMVAIWTISTLNTVMQYNEVGYTRRPGADGEAFDTDHAEDGCLIQYNYSHHNEGGFVLLCNGMPGTARNATIRYNLSVGDGGSEDGACIQFIGDVPGTQIYNNTFWLSEASRILDVWRNRAKDVRITGNIFAAPPGRKLAYTARPDPKPGGSVTEPDFHTAAEGFVIHNNIFHHVPLPAAGGGVTVTDCREEDPAFAVREFKDADYRDRTAMVAAFTPNNPMAGASHVPDNGGKDITGAAVSTDFYGCVKYKPI